MTNLDHRLYLSAKTDPTSGTPDPTGGTTNPAARATIVMGSGSGSSAPVPSPTTPVTTTYLTPGPLTIDQLLNSYTPSGSPATIQSDGFASQEQIDGVILHILETTLIETTEPNKVKVKASILALAQEGATSPKFAQNRTQSYFGIPVKVKDLKDGVNKYNTTIRKIARTLRNEAYLVAKSLGIPGNLSKNYLIDHPEADFGDLFWVSDFQTFNNDSSIPEQVKIWLLTNFKKRFKKD